MGNIILTTVRLVGSHACMREQESSQVSFAVAKGERYRWRPDHRALRETAFFFYSLRARGHLLACICSLWKSGNIWGRTKYKVRRGDGQLYNCVIHMLIIKAKRRQWWHTIVSTLNHKLRVDKVATYNTILIYNDYMWTLWNFYSLLVIK